MFFLSQLKNDIKNGGCPFDRALRFIAGPHLEAIKTRMRLASGERIRVKVRHPEKGTQEYSVYLDRDHVVLSERGVDITPGKDDLVLAKKPFVPLDAVDCEVYQMLEKDRGLDPFAALGGGRDLLQHFFDRFPISVWSRKKDA